MPGKQRLSLLLLVLFLTSCMVGPDYHRAPVMISSQFKEAKGKLIMGPDTNRLPNKKWKVAEPCDDIERGEWWKRFNDPTLNHLEDKLNRCNQNIANAAANYRQARAIVNEARASLFPTLIGTFNVLRQTQGGGTTSFTSSSAATGTTVGTATTSIVTNNPRVTNTYADYLNANWEPDIWGQVRRLIESDEAAAQSSAALWAVTRLSAQGSLAQYYFELRALDTDQRLLDKTVVAYETTLQLTRNQYASGVAGQADVVQAQSQVDVAKAQAINNGILRGQYEHAIAILIGLPPAEFSMAPSPLTATVPPVPLIIPSVWLERRPDIAQAERLMQQANAAIGVAISTYYPTLNLSGSGSGAANALHNLIDYPVIGWSLGLTLVETIYDGGLRDATVRAARAAYEAQVAAYRQVVLTAFQEVEDDLVALRLLQKQRGALDAAAANAKLALKLVINQYKAGTVPYSSVITSQIAAFSAEKNAADVIGLEMTAAAGLVKALGGGWNAQLLNGPYAGVKN